MSNCSCVYVVSDNYPEFYSALGRVAKKEHKCTECEEIIKPDEWYEYVSGKWESDFLVYKTCKDCLSVRDTFFCEGHCFGNIWEDLIKYINTLDGKISSDCITVLTPYAREQVCDLIEECWRDKEERGI